MPRGRPCKYGSRVDGKCPPKPKTAKRRTCKYGERVNGKCPPKPRTAKRRPCKYGERVNNKCPPKSKRGKYAHHVECTIEYRGDFKSEAQLSDWFKNGDSSSYINKEEAEEEEVYNFKYKPEVVVKRGRYGDKRYYYVHIEFDTNKNEEYINDIILGAIESNDTDGNYPVNGELVTGEIIDDTLYISNSPHF